MAFWSSWFAASCARCNDKIVGAEPVERDGRSLCIACNKTLDELAAKKEAELQARRAAEEAARAKFEGAKRFGQDERYES